MIILPGDAKKAQKKERMMRGVRPPRSVRKNYYDLLKDQVLYLKAQTANLSDLLTGGADRAVIADTLAKMSAATQARMDSVAPAAAKGFVSAASAVNKKAVEGSIASALSVDFASIVDGTDIGVILDMSVAENVGLIKSIGNEHFAQVARAVLNNYQGLPQPDGLSLQDRLKKLGKITDDRAKFIARDQTSKLTGNLNQARQQDNGIDEYEWMTAEDNRVVGTPGGKYPKGSRGHMNHYARQGKRFSWSDPPPDGHPGQAYNCRCYAKPVLNLEKLKAQYI